MAPWMTPGTGAEAVPGLTDFGARSGGEGEVGASVIGTYWFAQGVDEMTAHPRPASPEPTTVVETDHPLWSCPPRRRGGTGNAPRQGARGSVPEPRPAVTPAPAAAGRDAQNRPERRRPAKMGAGRIAPTGPRHEEDSWRPGH